MKIEARQNLPASRVPEAISFEEFLTLYDGQHAELVNGRVEIIMANNLQHLMLTKFLIRLLEAYLEAHPVGQLLIASFSMWLGADKPTREPDLMIVLNEHQARITSTYLDGAADIAIEIVSPESVDRDYGTKFREYESAGVREYWIFDPLRQIADIHVLGEDGVYHRRTLNASGHLTSTLLPNFELNPALLWRDPLPGGSEIMELIQAMSR
ncbi:MAG: Uma2 family endonuclease [Anaerolineae bacterium]|nr:Uma2 family endonuclease [Anaerolineae bacterium]